MSSTAAATLTPPSSASTASRPARGEPTAPTATKPPPRPETGPPGGLWDWLTLIALGVLVYHVLALWYCWLRPDPEFLAFSVAIVQVLAIAGFLGSQTELGRRVLVLFDKALARRRRFCLSVWVITAVAALFLHVGSPLAAHLFNRHGATALEGGRNSVAMRDFRRAVSLSPRNARAHFNLASAYEVLHDTEHAIAEYQIALELDDGLWPAYNNLGRLYLRARSDPDAALTVLLAGHRQADDPLGQAIMGKNIAWAYLEKGLPLTAVMMLEEAAATLQALQGQGQSVEIYLAEAHRLRALAYEVLSSPADARRAWQDTLGYALSVAESEPCAAGTSRPPPDCLDALRWAAEAREWLARYTGGP